MYRTAVSATHPRSGTVCVEDVQAGQPSDLGSDLELFEADLSVSERFSRHRA